tara:strand:+ start:1055 stop:1309 length:255 start_codon:yes stop_codon:yes gene_type:complete
MTDQMDDLMKAAEACVAEATPETLEPGKLRLVQVMEAEIALLRAQVQRLEEENNRLDQENKLNVAERNEWRTKYALIHHGLAVE